MAYKKKKSAAPKSSQASPQLPPESASSAAQEPGASAIKTTASASGSSPAPSFAPVALTEAQKNALISTLESLHARCMSDLTPLTDKFKLWRDFYDGSITVDPATKPWLDSAEVFFPLILMIADTARARLLQTYFQQRDVATIEAAIQDSDYKTLHGAELADDISACRRFINFVALAEDEMNLKEAMDSAFGEETQVGTAAIKVFHDFRRGKKKRRGMDGKIVKSEMTITDRIRIKIIPIEQCFWDTTAEEFAELRFIGYDFTLSSLELAALARDQKWTDEETREALRNSDPHLQSPVTNATERELMTVGATTTPVRLPDGTEYPVDPFARYTLREVWLMNQDIDADGYLEDSVIIWHPSSRVVRASLFPYIHNQPAISLGHYERNRNRCIGKPPAASITTLAAGVNAVANQAIDAQTIRNIPTVIGPEGNDSIETLRAQGFSPGQVLTYQTDPREISTLEFSGASNTVVSMEIFKYLLDVAFRVNHLGKGGFGDVSSAQRVAGDIGQAIMAEGLELLDRINAHNRRLGSRLMTQWFAICWQTQRGKFAQVLGEDDAKKVERLVNATGLDKLRFSLNISSAVSSRELDRQNDLAMGGFLTETLRQFVELVDRVSGGVDPKSGEMLPPNPVVAEAGTLIVRAVQNWLTRTIEAFPQITDAAPYVPDIAGFLEEQKALQGSKAPIGANGGGGGIPNVGMGPGAGSLLS